MTPRTRKPSRHFIVAVLGMAPLACLLAPSLALAASTVEKLQEFPLDEVQITDEYQKNLFAKDVTYLIKTLDSDRLLAGFKAVSAGTNASNLYGGWENSNIRGHTMGHWLSAVAHAYRQAVGSDPTLAAQIKTKLDDVMSKLKTYQLANGFLFATPISQFDDMDAGTGSTWVPYYTMHKILAGLVDVYKYEENPDALAVASKLGDWLYNRSQGWNSAAKGRVLGSEYGGMNDALYELYKLTSNANHLTVAHVFDDTGLFSTMAAGTDNLNGKHANMTIPKFVGALNRYRTVGTSEASSLNAATGFLDIVLKNHTYITGGNSENEHFHAAGALDADRDALNNETCNAYNMSKLGRDLFLTTGDVKYADYYERVHINEILSSMNPDTGMTTYFKAMGTGFFKVFGSETNHFWCCTGTGMENFTKLNDGVYFHDAKDLWLTYYVSSTLNWKDRGLALAQTTDLPLSDKVTITVTAAPTDAVAFKFRKPYWASTCQVGISVNGQAVSATESGGFYSVSRVWQANDKIELSFPLFVQFSRLQDNQNAVAFTYGPIVLSAGLGTASMTTQGTGVSVLMATKPSGIQEGFAISSGTINDWLSNIQKNLVQTPGKLEFNLKGTDSDGKLVFIPHFSRYKDRYGIYWKLTGTAGGTASTAVTCPTGTGGSGGSGGSTGTAGTTGTGGKGGTTGVTSSGSVATEGGKTTSSGGGTAGAAGNGGKASSGGTISGGAGVVASSSSSVAGQVGGGKSSVVASNSAVAGSSGNPGGGSAGSNNSGAAGSSGTKAGAGSSESSSGKVASQGSGGCSFAGQASNGQLTIGLLLGLGLMLARRRSNRRR
jgi:uncharacterized protein